MSENHVPETLREEVSDATRKSSNAAQVTDGLLDEKASPHWMSAVADGAVMGVALLTKIFFFTTCENCYFYSWYLLSLILIGKGAAGLIADNVAADPSIAPKKLLGSLNGVYLILGALIAFFAPLPSILLVSAIFLHAAVDLVSAQRPILRQRIPGFEEKGGPFFDKVSQYHVDSLRVVAAALEVAAFFTLIFCGFTFWLIYPAFLLLRFRSDRQARHLWRMIGGGVDKVVAHPALPPMVNQNYKLAKDTAYKAVSSF